MALSASAGGAVCVQGEGRDRRLFDGLSLQARDPTARLSFCTITTGVISVQIGDIVLCF